MIHFLRRYVSSWPLVAVLVGLPLVAAILYGCESQPEVIDMTSEDATEKCAALLDAGIDMVRPESLGLVTGGAILQSAPRQAAQTLSQWLRRSDCREAVPTEPLSDDGKALITRLLGSDGVEQTTTEQFSEFDAAHLRDALLDFSAADGISQGAEDDLDRVLRVFGYVARTVTPQGAGTIELPLTAYEAHLFGRGSPEDRTWLFASLLRQLRIDAVVVRPSTGTAEKSGPWWVAVLLDDGVFLFDPALGLPVPAPDSTVSAAPRILPMPATWSQAVENPEILVASRRDAGLEAPPIAADSLRAPQIELIGPAAFWKLPMERLELSLTADRGVLFYDPLHDTQAGPGLFHRVVEAGNGAWSEDAISIWPHTEKVRAARAELNQPQQQRLQARIQPYLGPVEVDENVPTLWETRIEHMSGRPGSAIGSYQQVRLAGFTSAGLSPSGQSLNRQAADEAYFWTAQAQFDEGMYADAAITLTKYMDQGGNRIDEAAGLRVVCYAANGATAEAADAVANLPETTPDLPRLRWLASQWREASPEAEAASNE